VLGAKRKKEGKANEGGFQRKVERRGRGFVNGER